MELVRREKTQRESDQGSGRAGRDCVCHDGTTTPTAAIQATGYALLSPIDKESTEEHLGSLPSNWETVHSAESAIETANAIAYENTLRFR